MCIYIYIYTLNFGVTESNNAQLYIYIYILNFAVTESIYISILNFAVTESNNAQLSLAFIYIYIKFYGYWKQ